MSGYSFEDDKLAITVKADGAEDIKKAYAVFGWRLVKQYGDEKYGDIIHMDFVREHKIEGKDRLQLLQVRFEVAVNFLGKAPGRLSVRAGIIGALLSLIGIALIVYGAVVAFYSTTTVFYATGIGVISGGILFVVFALFVANKVFTTDKQTSGAVAAVLRDNIKDILAEASRITGVKNAG